MVYSNYYLGDLIGEIFSFLYDVIILDTPHTDTGTNSKRILDKAVNKEKILE